MSLTQKCRTNCLGWGPTCYVAGVAQESWVRDYVHNDLSLLLEVESVEESESCTTRYILHQHCTVSKKTISM